MKRAAHLTSLAGVCVVWRSENSMELSRLCMQIDEIYDYVSHVFGVRGAKIIVKDKVLT